MKNLFLISFSIFLSLTSFSQEDSLKEADNLIYSQLSVFIAYNGNNDLSNLHRNKKVDLMFAYDSVSQIMTYTVFFKKSMSFSSGELTPFTDPCSFDDHPEGKQFFLWNYFNSYDDKNRCCIDYC